MRGICALVLLSGTMLSFPVGAAVHDISGHWSANANLRVMVERQFNSFKVSVLDRRNGAQRWGVVSGPATAENGFSAALTLDGGDAKSLDLDFSDPTHGILKWDGQTFPITRVQFATNGLLAPIDANGPETGWYASKSQPSTVAFAERQGAVVKITKFKPGTAPLETQTSNLTNFSLTHISVANGNALSTFVKNDFENPATPLPAPTSPSAYALPKKLEAVIKAIPAASSMRVRSGLREHAAAYVAYFTSPTVATAQASAARALVAFACIEKLTPTTIDTATKAALYEKLFDTDAKADLFLDMHAKLGTVVIENLGVTVSNPGQCITFMQGVVRLNVALTGTAKSSFAGPAVVEAEQAQAAKARREHELAHPSVFTTQAGTTIGKSGSCNAALPEQADALAMPTSTAPRRRNPFP